MKRHPIQIDDGLWQKLWSKAQQSKTPSSPAQVARDILENFFKHSKKRKKIKVPKK